MSDPCLVVVEVQLLQSSGVSQTVRHGGHAFISDRVTPEVQGHDNACLQRRRLRKRGQSETNASSWVGGGETNALEGGVLMSYMAIVVWP